MQGKRLIFRNIIMFATALSLWGVWLPMMRTLSGQNSYVWANEYFNTLYKGVGWSGDYLILIYQAIIGVSIIWMGFRNPRQPFQFLLIVWHSIPFLNALYIPLIAGKRNIFIGDTGGVRWDITWLTPLITGITLAIVICWLFYEQRFRKAMFARQSWSKTNTQFLLIFTAYLIGVTILEWTGDTHGATDMIAVPLNILAPTLIALMFYPWKSGRSHHQIQSFQQPV